MTSTMPKPTAAAAPVKEEKPAAAADESPLLKSVSAMRTLSFAISAFSRRFDELQKHLDSIQNSIEQKSKELGSCKDPSQPLQQQQQQHVQQQLEEPAPNPNPNPSAPPDPVQDHRSEVERLCETMSGRGLRKYVVSHLSNVDELRLKVSEALKRAPDPGHLVLDCIGGFYLQGKKAYTRDSPMITSRHACILLLEFYLVSGCSNSKMEPSVKEEAEKAAIGWRSRLVQEGGIANAGDADALGLLLFVAAFGIPSKFGRDDLYELIRLSNLQKKADVLRRFPALVQRIKDLIQGMVNNGMHVTAVGLACVFGLKDKFSPVLLLSSFVQEANRIGIEMRREGQCSYVSLKEANEKQVAALKLVAKCVEDHKLNCAEVASWQIDQKIAKLEKEIAKFEKKRNDRNLKRKAEDESSTQVKTQEHRHRPTTIEALAFRSRPEAIPSQEQNLYDGLLPKAIFAGGFPGLVNRFSDASIKSDAVLSDGSGMGLLSGNVTGALAGLGSGHGLPAGPHPSADSIWLSTGNGVGAFPVTGSGMPPLVGTSSNEMVRSYGWHKERAVNNNSVVQHSLLGQPSSAGQSFMRLSAPMVKEISGSSHQGSTSDLYQFADTVLQNESYYSSSVTGNAAPVVYPPSYF